MPAFTASTVLGLDVNASGDTYRRRAARGADAALAGHWTPATRSPPDMPDGTRLGIRLCLTDVNGISAAEVAGSSPGSPMPASPTSGIAPGDPARCSRSSSSPAVSTRCMRWVRQRRRARPARPHHPPRPATRGGRARSVGSRHTHGAAAGATRRADGDRALASGRPTRGTWRAAAVPGPGGRWHRPSRSTRPRPRRRAAVERRLGTARYGCAGTHPGRARHPRPGCDRACHGLLCPHAPSALGVTPSPRPDRHPQQPPRSWSPGSRSPPRPRRSARAPGRLPHPRGRHRPLRSTFFEDVQGPYAETVFHSWLLLVRGITRRTGARGVSLRRPVPGSSPRCGRPGRRGDRGGTAALAARAISRLGAGNRAQGSGPGWGSPRGAPGPGPRLGVRAEPYADTRPPGQAEHLAQGRWHASPGSSTGGDTGRYSDDAAGAGCRRHAIPGSSGHRVSIVTAVPPAAAPASTPRCARRRCGRPSTNTSGIVAQRPPSWLDPCACSTSAVAPAAWPCPWPRPGTRSSSSTPARCARLAAPARRRGRRRRHPRGPTQGDADSLRRPSSRRVPSTWSPCHGTLEHRRRSRPRRCASIAEVVAPGGHLSASSSRPSGIRRGHGPRARRGSSSPGRDGPRPVTRALERRATRSLAASINRARRSHGRRRRLHRPVLSHGVRLFSDLVPSGDLGLGRRSRSPHRARSTRHRGSTRSSRLASSGRVCTWWPGALTTGTVRPS
jgi:hypothetical protein